MAKVKFNWGIVRRGMSKVVCSVMIALAIVSFSSCKDDDEDDNPNSSTSKSYEPEMVSVAGDTFMMGDSTFTPVHQVTLSSFKISKYEITQKLWVAIMGNNPSSFQGDNLPVERVSWEDIQTFIQRLNDSTGKNYRLPTEAEWEYAARGGNLSQGYSGSNNIDNVAWYIGNSSGKTHVVGEKQPNELGIYDMSGNVYEWVNDRYSAYSSEPQTNPQGASTGSYRVLHGGSWADGATGTGF